MNELFSRITRKIQYLKGFFRNPSYPRTLALIGILILIAIIPITVVVLQQQTQTQQHAAVVSSDGGGSYGTSCRATGSSCGVNTDCCSGNYCSRTGFCTKYCTPAITYNVCYGNYVCTRTYNYNKICGSTNYSNCQHVDGKCGYVAAKDSCPSGSIGCRSTGICTAANGLMPAGSGTCAVSGNVCCKALVTPTPLPKISCTGSVGTCVGSSYNGGLTTCANANFYPNTSTCTDNGQIGVCCKTGSVIQPDFSGCTNFPPDPRTNTTTDGACQTIAIGYRPQCKYDKYYKVNVSTNPVTCVFSPPGTTPPSTPSCASLSGTCYSNNSCATGAHEVTATCTTGRLCCVPNIILTCISNGGHCQTTGSTCAPSGSQRVLNLDLSCGGSGSNQICCSGPAVTKAPTTTTTGGGGSGGTGGTGGGGTNPVPACTNGKATGFALSMKLDGIGTGEFENSAPAHTGRQAIYVKVTDQSNNVVYNNTTTQFSHASGRFNNPSVNLGTGLVCSNTYTVTTKLPRYLSTKAALTYGISQTINMNPIVGDINRVDLATKAIVGDDKIDVNDYALVRACHNVDPTTPQTFTSGATTVTLTCADLMNFFDYTDGGTQGDHWAFNYNLWLRGYLKANGL